MPLLKFAQQKDFTLSRQKLISEKISNYVYD